VGLLAIALLCVTWSFADAHPSTHGREPVAQAVKSSEVAPVEASAAAPTTSTPVGDTSPTSPLETAAAVLLAVLSLGLRAIRAPATVRGLLAALTVFIGVEGAIHSVHHLDNARAAEDCKVFALIQQLHGDTHPELSSGAPVVTFRPYAVTVVLHEAPEPVRRPDRGRAPPLPSA
jgi:hypothetical protein